MSKEKEAKAAESTVTEEQIKRMRKERENLGAGVVESQMPEPRSGYVQYLSTEGLMKRKVQIGYTQRLSEDGNPMYVEDKAGRKMPIMEIPQILWDDSRKLKEQRAKAPMEQVLKEKTFGDSEQYFQSSGEISRETTKYKKSRD